jgi:hypothetical protein
MRISRRKASLSSTSGCWEPDSSGLSPGSHAANPRPLPMRARSAPQTPLRTTPRRRRSCKVMRREAHESYGVALELRVDAQRDRCDALLGANPLCGLAMVSPPLRRKLLSRDSKRGACLSNYSPDRETNFPLAPGAISYAYGALGRVRDISLFAVETARPRRAGKMAKNYQRRCCVSSHPPQIRWPKVFGRVESLDWRGLRDTSRSDRICPMGHRRGAGTMILWTHVARRVLSWPIIV